MTQKIKKLVRRSRVEMVRSFITTDLSSVFCLVNVSALQFQWDILFLLYSYIGNFCILTLVNLFGNFNVMSDLMLDLNST